MQRRQRAFTLVELAIVLAVVSIVAAYVAPDFIEMARTQLAERAAEDIMEMQDAARWFYHDSPMMVGSMDPGEARWPGEATPSSCSSAGPTPDTELIARDYLTGPDFTNPWSRPYETDVWQPGANPGQCRFMITTNVPSGVALAMASQVPLMMCERVEGDMSLCTGDPPAGWDRCCTRLVKPGYEASVERVLPSICSHTLGGVWNPATEQCDPRGEWDWTDCEWLNERESGDTDGDGTPENMCTPGKVVVETRDISCGKYCQQTEYKCCEGRP